MSSSSTLKDAKSSGIKGGGANSGAKPSAKIGTKAGAKSDAKNSAKNSGGAKNNAKNSTKCSTKNSAKTARHLPCQKGIEASCSHLLHDELLYNYEFCDSEVICLAIGKFDGFHIGHQTLLRALDDYVAKARGGVETASFDLAHSTKPTKTASLDSTHSTQTASFYSTQTTNLDSAKTATTEKKATSFDLAKATKSAHQSQASQSAIIVIEYNKPLHFTRDQQDFTHHKVYRLSLSRIKNYHPIYFLSILVHAFPNLRHIVVGYDFRFGIFASFDARYLASVFIERFGGSTTIIEPILLEGAPIHTQDIKGALDRGDMEFVTKAFARIYEIKGTRVNGQGIGRSHLYPTINTLVCGYFLPRDGVYITRVRLGGRCYGALTFIGERSTDARFSIESHILEPLDEDIEIDEIGIGFIKMIGQVRYFDNLDDLKATIANYIEIGLKFFNEK